jgi:hypothetical protein
VKTVVGGAVPYNRWSDDPVEAKEHLEMGIDTILTNNFGIISQIK